MGNSLIIFHLKMFTHVATAAVLAAVSVPELEQFLGGLFFGLLQDDHLDKIKLCLTDAKSVETEMLEAVADIQKKDLMDMIKATKIIGTIVTQVHGDITDCKGMDADAKRIEKWAAIFKNPTELAQRVFANGMSNRGGLMNDIAEVKTDVSTKNLKDLGLTVADIITKTVGPSQLVQQMKKLSTFIDHI